MDTINSLNRFFSEIACHFQCFNMGRRIFSVDQSAFVDFENTHSAWNAPFLQHAWLAIVFWRKDRSKDKHQNHHVWFLKLPLDEQAKLNLAARDDFLRGLFEALGNDLSLSPGEKAAHSSSNLRSLENAMQDNPYGFQPKAEQMANFHAIVHQQLLLPASSYYAATQIYFSGKNNFHHWDKLGIQGFADIAARLDESYRVQDSVITNNEQLINKAIVQLPIAPFKVLCSCLEHHPVSKQTTQIIYERLIAELEKSNKSIHLTQESIASIQATSQSKDKPLQIQLLSKILQSSEKSDIEVLATISGRCWPLISHPEILPLFLEALAIADLKHIGAFKAILSDLMFIPGLRANILPAFRSPQRSEQLTQAIGTFFRSL